MSNYRCYFVPRGTYFFTLVAYRRRAFLTFELARRCLREALMTVRIKRPVEILAMVLLPDHLHVIWTLPPGDSDYPTRWRLAKSEFTTRYLAAGE
jgi:putative transposase